MIRPQFRTKTERLRLTNEVRTSLYAGPRGHRNPPRPFDIVIAAELLNNLLKLTTCGRYSVEIVRHSTREGIPPYRYAPASIKARIYDEGYEEDQ